MRQWLGQWLMALLWGFSFSQKIVSCHPKSKQLGCCCSRKWLLLFIEKHQAVAAAFDSDWAISSPGLPFTSSKDPLLHREADLGSLSVTLTGVTISGQRCFVNFPFKNRSVELWVLWVRLKAFFRVAMNPSIPTSGVFFIPGAWSSHLQIPFSVIYRWALFSTT